MGGGEEQLFESSRIGDASKIAGGESGWDEREGFGGV